MGEEPSRDRESNGASYPDKVWTRQRDSQSLCAEPDLELPAFLVVLPQTVRDDIKQLVKEKQDQSSSDSTLQDSQNMARWAPDIAVTMSSKCTMSGDTADGQLL